jgi:hypothetical protein
MQKRFNQTLIQTAEGSRKEYLELFETQGADMAYETVSQGAFEKFTAQQ